MNEFGVVAIGRNEGERLRQCLSSVEGQAAAVVYVDSGSTDSSVAMARAAGADVVELDIMIPFTAARARNEGFRRLLELSPGLQYVQFVDGDCEVVQGWLETAVSFLEKHQDAAVVCGRRRERFPDKSLYNLLCDNEWNSPIGEAKACGGDALMRIAAFYGVGGYRADLIAGEEPELCVRLRGAGWKVWRIDREMTLHDAAMTRFDQWWKRTTRAGYAFAEGAYLHGKPPESHWIKESRRARIWGLGIPAIALMLVGTVGWWGFLVLLIYPFQVVRLHLKARGNYDGGWSMSIFLVLGKFPEALGQLKFLYHRLTGVKGRLIEYK
jgi:glycosyltransferase involved in cell wall biosynthesis